MQRQYRALRSARVGASGIHLHPMAMQTTEAGSAIHSISTAHRRSKVLVVHATSYGALHVIFLPSGSPLCPMYVMSVPGAAYVSVPSTAYPARTGPHLCTAGICSTRARICSERRTCTDTRHQNDRNPTQTTLNFALDWRKRPKSTSGTRIWEGARTQCLLGVQR